MSDPRNNMEEISWNVKTGFFKAPVASKYQNGGTLSTDYVTHDVVYDATNQNVDGHLHFLNSPPQFCS
jgi:hypothetical protein